MNKANGRLIAVAGMVTLGLVLGGCASGSGGSDATAAAKPGKISGTLTILEQATAGALAGDPVTAAFEKKYPNVKVKVVYDPSTGWQTFFANTQTKLASGQKFDLIYLPTEGEKLFASKGLLNPLDSWTARDKTTMDAFYASANKTVIKSANTFASVGGKKYFIPYLFNTMGMYVNKATFAKAGVPLPSADWTWADFRATCEKLKAAGTRFCFDPNTSFFQGISPWLLSNGAGVLNEDWTKAVTDSPKAIEAVTFVRGLVKDGLVPTPSSSTNSSNDPNTLFANGQIAMMGGGSWIASSLLAAKTPLEDMQVLPWPTGAQQGTPVGWGALGMMKSGQNKEAAWEYIKFELSPQIQDLIGKTRYNGAIPVLESSVDKSLSVQPAGFKYLYDALNYSTPVPGPPASVQVQTDTGSAYTSILSGSIDPAAGMKELATKLNADLAATK